MDWASIVGVTPWLAAREHLTPEELQWFYDEPGSQVPSELELIMEDVWHHTTEEAAQGDSSNQSVAPCQVKETQPRDSPEQQQQQHPTEPEERPHKFQLVPGWVQVSGDYAGPQDRVPYHTLAEYDNIDDELGKGGVQDVLGNYLTETEAAVQGLIHDNRGITGSEAMEVDLQEVAPATSSPEQPMETEPETSASNFRPELTELGYTPSLVSSLNSPPSPVMAQEDVLLDPAVMDSPSQDQPKAPGSGRLEGSPSKLGMTLRKRKP